MKCRTFLSIFFVVVVVIALESMAEPPRLINYQGKLTDSLNQTVSDSAYSMTFSLYDVNMGGTALWSEGPVTVPVENGLFTYILGVHNPLPDSLIIDNAELYLGVKVDPNPEMFPRSPLISVPYSIEAVKAGFANEAEMANMAMLAEHVVENSITSAQIADSSIEFVDLGSNGADSGQVIKWVDGHWQPAEDETGSGGSVTIIAGEGLRSDGTPEEIILNVGASETIQTDDSTVALNTEWTDNRYLNEGGDTLTNTLSFDHMGDGTVETRIEIGRSAFETLTDDGKVTASLFQYDSTNHKSGHLKLSVAENGDYKEIVDLGMYYGGGGVEFTSGGSATASLTGTNNGALLLKDSISQLGVVWLNSAFIYERAPFLYLSDTTGFINTYLTGAKDTGAVFLPDGSIGAHEISNEPGIAKHHTGTIYTWISDSAIYNLDSCAITIPVPGYVVALAYLPVDYQGPGVGVAYFNMDIFELHNPMISSNSSVVGYPDDSGMPSFNREEVVTCENTFYFDQPGTKTIYLNGTRVSFTNSLFKVMAAKMILMYFPTSYGLVSKVGSFDNLTQFNNIENISAVDPKTGESKESYRVDLRELELRVEQKRREALQAEKDLLKARLEEKLSQSNQRN